MAKRTIRYKKPEWQSWVYITVPEEEIDKWIENLEAKGYQVEK